MIMSPAQTANLMGILGATFARSGLSTRAECCASISWNYAQQFAAYLWGAATSGLTGPNTGLVEVKGNTVTTSGRLWAFASYSRFIRPGAVRIGTTTSAAGLNVTAFRNGDGSIAVIVLNSAHSRQVATFSLRGLGGAHVTPYLTDSSHELSAQSPIAVRNSAFTATLPPRSLVSYDIRS
jgi:O-glycosyl hydrolase